MRYKLTKKFMIKELTEKQDIFSINKTFTETHYNNPGSNRFLICQKEELQHFLNLRLILINIA